MIQMVKQMDARQNIRNAHNKFAHDYPDDWERNAALINVACEAAADMYDILTGIETKLKIDQPVLELGKSLSEAYPKQLSRCKELGS
jgi:hypothetical protein